MPAPPKAIGLNQGWLNWGRHLFASPGHALLSLLILGGLAKIVPSLIEWGLVKAVWSGGPADCRAAGGACWAFVGEKFRLILFGIYPHDQQWRPSLAIVLFLAMLLVSANPKFWRRWLFWMWASGLVVSALLMWGGIAGLPFVADDRWGGLPLTLILSTAGIVLSFPLALLLALGRRSSLPALRSLSIAYIEFWRGVPLVSVLFMASVMFPLFLPEGISIDKLLRAQLGIILFTAAYLAENVRGGLQAIPVGQSDAADALGLGYWQKMRLVILPQALRLVIPPLVGQFITTFKDTSLVVVIGLYDLLSSTKMALSDPQWRAFYVEGYLVAAAIYFLFTHLMSRYSRYLERRLASSGGSV
ncbi:MAG TPA: amino acid ABC transporter permease [Rhodospirillaceae bacterium]|nr:amino acid ABC transporter permease [Rhodospirillaceae bacterium]